MTSQPNVLAVANPASHPKVARKKPWGRNTMHAGRYRFPDPAAVIGSVMVFLFLARGGNGILRDWLGRYLFR